MGLFLCLKFYIDEPNVIQMSSTLSIHMQGNEARASLYASIHATPSHSALAVLIQQSQRALSAISFSAR